MAIAVGILYPLPGLPKRVGVVTTGAPRTPRQARTIDVEPRAPLFPWSELLVLLHLRFVWPRQAVAGHSGDPLLPEFVQVFPSVTIVGSSNPLKCLQVNMLVFEK